MGLINSMVNQVGREIGRDLYRGARSSAGRGGRRSFGRGRRSLEEEFLTVNEQLIRMIQDKRWSEKMRFNAMAADIEACVNQVREELDPCTLDWMEVLSELDKRIDELKMSCTEEQVAELDRLDRLNYGTFRYHLKAHRDWIDNTLQRLKGIKQAPPGYQIFLLSIAGLASTLLGRSIGNAVCEFLFGLIFWGFLVVGFSNRPAGGIDRDSFILIAIGLGLFLISLLGNMVKLGDLRKIAQINTSRYNATLRYRQNMDKW